MLRLFPVDHDLPPEPDPQGLLPRLAEHGVRFFDSRRWLLIDVPVQALEHADWPRLEAALQKHSAVLQVLAGEVHSAMDEMSPDQLRQRILDLPARSLPTLMATLGGLGSVFDPGVAESSPAKLELCYAAFLRALREQAIDPIGEE